MKMLDSAAFHIPYRETVRPYSWHSCYIPTPSTFKVHSRYASCISFEFLHARTILGLCRFVFFLAHKKLAAIIPGGYTVRTSPDLDALWTRGQFNKNKKWFNECKRRVSNQAHSQTKLFVAREFLGRQRTNFGLISCLHKYRGYAYHKMIAAKMSDFWGRGRRGKAQTLGAAASSPMATCQVPTSQQDLQNVSKLANDQG